MLLSGRRCLTPSQLAKVGRLLGIEPTHLPLREPLEEHGGAERDHREDGQALQHHLRAESRRVPVRHRRLQPAFAVRADDAAQQPLLLAELRAEQAADEAHRRRFLAHDDGRRVLHLESRPDARRQRQPLSLHAARARGQRDRAEESAAQHRAAAARLLPRRQQLRVPPIRRA